MSKFSPDHLGRKTPDSNSIRSLNRSHNTAAEQPTPGYGSTIARSLTDPTPHDPRQGKSKAGYDVKIHGGQTTVARNGALAFGGDHKSAIDSLTGLSVVPGKDGRVATAHPLVSPPTAKNLRPVATTPGMRSRQGGLAKSLDDPTLHELGRCIMDTAVGNK